MLIAALKETGLGRLGRVNGHSRRRPPERPLRRGFSGYRAKRLRQCTRKRWTCGWLLSVFCGPTFVDERERERKTNTGRLKTLLRLLLELIIIWCFVIFWCFTVTERFTPSRLESYARLGWPEATRTLARFANPWRHEPEFWVGIRVWRLSTGFSLFPFAPGVVGAC